MEQADPAEVFAGSLRCSLWKWGCLCWPFLRDIWQQRYQRKKVKKRKLKETAFQGEQVKCDWYWPLQDLLCPLTLASGNWGRFSIGLGSFWEQDCEIRKKERRNKNKNRNKIELKRISLEIQLSFHKSHTCYRFCLHWRWGALLWKYKSPCNILWPGAVEKK